MNPTTPTRSLFATKTAFAQYVTGAVGLVAVFYPPAGTFVAENAPGILIAAAVANLLLRKITSGRVVLFAE
jgi:hypothetical protein